MKLPELISFMEQYALSVDQKKEERVIASKSQSTLTNQRDQSGYQHLTNGADVQEHILASDQAAVVYVASKDSMPHLEVIEDLASKYGEFMNIALYVVEEDDNAQRQSQTAAELKKEFKSAKVPQMRFYPNGKKDGEKREASFEIMLPKSVTDIDQIKESVFEEIQSNFISDVKDVSEKVYYSLSGSNARDGIITVLYMYDSSVDENGVDFVYKAVSAEPYLQDGFQFMAVDGPSESMQQKEPLPAIQGMLTIDEENPSPRIFNFQGMQEVHYREIVHTLLKLIPERWEAYEEEMRVKQFKKQNPTASDDSDARRQEPRIFGEIASQNDWEKKCRSRKACGIALLPAITSIGYERESYEEKMAILEELETNANRYASVVHYSWVNATCHPEIFEFFDIDPTMLPTMVYYNSQHNKYGKHIGMFTKEMIEDHEERFKKGSLSLQDAKVDRKEINFADKGACENLQLDSADGDALDDDFDEIMAEIAAEEQARKAEQAGGAKSKKKQKKKGKKKGKKGKKSEQNEEL